MTPDLEIRRAFTVFQLMTILEEPRNFLIIIEHDPCSTRMPQGMVDYFSQGLHDAAKEATVLFTHMELIHFWRGYDQKCPQSILLRRRTEIYDEVELFEAQKDKKSDGLQARGEPRKHEPILRLANLILDFGQQECCWQYF